MSLHHIEPMTDRGHPMAEAGTLWSTLYGFPPAWSEFEFKFLNGVGEEILIGLNP